MDRDTAIAMVMAVDDDTIGCVFRRSRFAAGDRRAGRPRPTRTGPAWATSSTPASLPRLAEVYRNQADLEPPADTFERGLEWMFTGMQAVLDARRG